MRSGRQQSASAAGAASAARFQTALLACIGVTALATVSYLWGSGSGAQAPLAGPDRPAVAAASGIRDAALLAAAAASARAAAGAEGEGVEQAGDLAALGPAEVTFTDADGDVNTLRTAPGGVDWWANGKLRASGLRVLAYSSVRGRGAGAVLAPPLALPRPGSAPSADAPVGAGSALVADLRADADTGELLRRIGALCGGAQPIVEWVVDGVARPLPVPGDPTCGTDPGPGCHFVSLQHAAPASAPAEIAGPVAAPVEVPQPQAAALDPRAAMWNVGGDYADPRCAAGPGVWCDKEPVPGAPGCSAQGTCAKVCKEEAFCATAPASVVPSAPNKVIPPIAGYWYGLVDFNRGMMQNSGKDAKILFFGDSLTEGLNGTRGGAPLPKAKERQHFQRIFQGVPVTPSGLAGDETQHMLWRVLRGGELNAGSPEVVVLLAGTNNIGVGHQTAQSAALGVAAVTQALCNTFPRAALVVLGIPPRTDCLQWQVVRKSRKKTMTEKGCVVGDKAGSKRIPIILAANAMLRDILRPGLCPGTVGKPAHPRLRFANCWDELSGPDPARIPPEYYQDNLHLSAKGYDTLWRHCLFPALRQLAPQLPLKIMPEFDKYWN